MAKEQVLLKITGIQTRGGEEPEIIELTTVGSKFHRDQDVYFVYEESGVTGLEGTTTTLKVQPQQVTLNRMGQVQSKQIFAEDQLHRSHYVSPYGTFHLGVRPSLVKISLTPEGGKIDLAYELFLEDGKLSDNTLAIEISPIKKQ